MPNKIVNGVEIQLTEEEIAARTQEEDVAAVRYAQKLSEFYKHQREEEYPSIGDQLDMLYWDKMNGTSTWQDMVTSIKAQYPKPE